MIHGRPHVHKGTHSSQIHKESTLLPWGAGKYQGRRGELQPNWQKHNPNPSWNNKELYSFLSYSLTVNDAVWETIRQPVEFLSGRSGSSRWLKQELTNQQSCFHIAAPQLDELHLNIECIPYLYLVLLGQWFSVHRCRKLNKWLNKGWHNGCGDWNI